jgi:hypothetical protein
MTGFKVIMDEENPAGKNRRYARASQSGSGSRPSILIIKWAIYWATGDS